MSNKERRDGSVVMMSSATASLQRRELLNNFLFASICEDSNNMSLSVLSALARLDIDPWQEAANLSELSKEAATKRLASLIMRLPLGASPRLDPEATAARLIALLPQQGESEVSWHPSLDLGALAESPTSIYKSVIYVIFTAFILAALSVAIYGPPLQTDRTPPNMSDRSAHEEPKPLDR